MVRIPCDFQIRPIRDKEIFTQTTWCDSCYANDLGMLDPVEYKIDDKTYLEGKCTRCGSIVVSEIYKQNIDGEEEDIIWPSRDDRKPSSTYLPRKAFNTFVQGSPSAFDFFPLRTPRKISKSAMVIFWIIVAAFVLIYLMIFFHNLIYDR